MNKQVILTKRNCHRAAQVRLVAAPENGVYEWSFRGVKVRENLMHTEYGHLAKQGEHEVCVRHIGVELGAWEVASWKYEFSFEDLWAKAVRAFSNTSFHPEERAEAYIRDYEAACLSDLQALPVEEHEEYISKFRGWVETLFDKHSRILSVMITGPARFPTARNDKANDAYGRAIDEFQEWREKYAKRIEKRNEAAKSPEEREAAEWETLKRDIDYNTNVCIEIDAGAKGSHRAAFTNSIFGKVERLAHNGRADLVLKALEYIKQLQEDEATGLKKPLFTSRHKIWNLQEACEKAIKAQEERENRDSVEIEFDGGTIVKNFAENRLQIFHDEKLSADVISRLKSNGFKWSRFNGCWQRQLTDNANYGADRVLYGNDVLSEERNKFITNLRAAK